MPWGSRRLPRPGRGVAGQREGKATAVAAMAGYPDAAAEVLDDAPADVQSQPAALRAGLAVLRLPEAIEDDLAVACIHARPVVAHVDAQIAALAAEADLDPAPSRLAELRGVRQQVQHHLDDSIDVRLHG